MGKTRKEIEHNREILSSGKFTWLDIPRCIKEIVPNDAKVYVLKPHLWVEVGGYKILLDKVASSDGVPSRIKLKYPPTVTLYWLRNIFEFLQKGIWLYDICRIPFTDLLISKWGVGDGSSERVFLATFMEKSGPSMSTGG